MSRFFAEPNAPLYVPEKVELDLDLSYQAAGDSEAIQDAIVATLPPEAQDKYHGLVDLNAEFLASTYAAYERKQEVERERAEAQSMLNNLLRDEERGLSLGTAGEKTKKDLERKIKRLSKRLVEMEATPRRSTGIHLEDFNTKFFKEARGKRLIMSIPDAKIPEGKKAEALADVREMIKTKCADHKATLKSARSIAEAEAIVTADIEKLVAGVNPFAVTLHQGRRTEWPLESHDSGGPHGRRMDYRDGVSLLCYLFKDELIARAKADIRARAEGRLMHTAHERKAALRKIEAELLELQRVEEVIFLACEDAGLNVTRWSPPGWHIDWRAILQVAEAPKE